MLERLLIAGSGGQGILLIGRILATVAVDEVPHVTFFPAYGAEVRGGASNCQVVLSSDAVSSPVPEQLDSMLILNEFSKERFIEHGAPRCLTILNTSLCSPSADTQSVSVPATEMADRLGDTRVANFIMLGAYLARKPIIPAGAVEVGIQKYMAAKNSTLVDLNIAALKAGLEV